MIEPTLEDALMPLRSTRVRAQPATQPRIGRAGAIRAQLTDVRWHFQHGPIDLVIDVDADSGTRTRAIEDCWDAFQSVLPALVAELPALRASICERRSFHGAVAERMRSACAPFADQRFITPMAAVAGAVADELITVFARAGVRRASINNGGDIALFLTAHTTYRVGVWAQLERLGRPRDDEASHGDSRLDGFFEINEAMPVRGIATSGWRGRSCSLGIADSVTVLAKNAASADAAATLIANAVDCDCAGIVRAPARELKDDSDLGDRLVTVEVPPLPIEAKRAALLRGRRDAERWREHGLIHAAVLFLQGELEVVVA